MRIRIIDESRYEPIDEYPAPGTYYLDSAESGTNEQNRLFHALLTEYFNSAAFSYNIKTFQEFKNYVKANMGAGYKKFVYVTIEEGKPCIHECKHREDIPAEAHAEYGILKSWAEYTKEERTRTIKTLINEMIFVGVNTARFNEILKEVSK